MEKMILTEESDWPDFSVRTERDLLIEDVESGRKFQHEAEEEAARLGLEPLFVPPDPADFPVMTFPLWSIEMVVAWIIWREADQVVKFDRDFYPRWICPKHPFGFDSFPQLSLSGVEALLRDSTERQSILSYDEALSSLFLKLQAGMVIASGVDLATRCRAEIPALDWYDLEVDKHVFDETLLTNKVTGDRRWLLVCFRRENIIDTWPAASQPEDFQSSGGESAKTIGKHPKSSFRMIADTKGGFPNLTPAEKDIHAAVAKAWPDGNIPNKARARNEKLNEILGKKEGETEAAKRAYQRYFKKMRDAKKDK